jgi:hypothetical protein
VAASRARRTGALGLAELRDFGHISEDPRDFVDRTNHEARARSDRSRGPERGE